MRILVVTNMYPTPAAPMFGIFVAEQVASLRRRGLALDVLFVDGSADWGKYLAGFGRVRAAIATGDYDLVHAHYVFSGLLALAASLTPVKTRRAPVILTHHGIEVQRGWTAALCRWTSNRVAATIVTSRRVQAALGRADAAIVPCGVDTALFRPLPQAECRAALGLPATGPLVLFAGVRRPEKRFDRVEAAIAHLRISRPDVRLVVAEREPHERMPFYMNACDALILASEAEGSPMVIKEAMACNLPIVSVDVGDVAEVIGGTAGCFLSAADPATLAGRLAEALDFGDRTEGRAAILEGRNGLPLSLAAAAERIETIYREVRSNYAHHSRRSAR